MYERPPPAEPDRSWTVRYLAVLPLAVATCSGAALVYLVLVQGVYGLTAMMAALITGIVSAVTWQGRQSGWNPNLMVVLWLALLIGFAALVYAVSRL